jgi:nitrite reductase/ring-hydroxylating ferredoxin subunit
MISTVHDIGQLDDFEIGKPYRCEVAGKALVIVRKGEAFYAMRDTCPHEGARLSDGKVMGLACADKPGERIDYCRKGEIISCPWHGWEFDLATGESVTRPDRVRVRTFSVRVEGERVLVDMSR